MIITFFMNNPFNKVVQYFFNKFFSKTIESKIWNIIDYTLLLPLKDNTVRTGKWSTSEVHLNFFNGEIFVKKQIWIICQLNMSNTKIFFNRKFVELLGILSNKRKFYVEINKYQFKKIIIKGSVGYPNFVPLSSFSLLQ